MIFYFSGTGNSQLTAKQIAEITGDEICSINKLLKEGAENLFSSDKPLVFVAPVYAWRLPRVVEKWILRSQFEGNRSAYFILTCGSGSGNASAYAKKLCRKKGMNFNGFAQVVMPENYLAMFQTPEKPQCLAIIEKAKPQIAGLARQIQQGKPFPETSAGFPGKLLSGPVNLIFYPLFVRDRGFTVSGDCISCEKCAWRCPLNNIDMVNGKPVWNGNCTHCMACICGCPAKAIEYGLKSKGRHRHYIMEE